MATACACGRDAATGKVRQTLKRATDAGTGLFRRDEWEVAVRGRNTWIATPSPQTPLAENSLAMMTPPPCSPPVFVVDTERRSAPITIGDSTVEVCLDQGAVIAGQRPHLAIDEVEPGIDCGQDAATCSASQASSLPKAPCDRDCGSKAAVGLCPARRRNSRTRQGDTRRRRTAYDDGRGLRRHRAGQSAPDHRQTRPLSSRGTRSGRGAIRCGWRQGACAQPSRCSGPAIRDRRRKNHRAGIALAGKNAGRCARA